MNTRDSCPSAWDSLQKQYQHALNLKNAGNLAAASKVFEMIATTNPAFNHGGALSNLAQCYEDLGRLDEAKRHYEAALRVDGLSPIFQGNYASFLYLHGDANEALSQYLRLVQLDSANGFEDDVIEEVLPAVRALARRIGLSETDADERFRAALRLGRAGEFPSEICMENGGGSKRD